MGSFTALSIAHPFTLIIQSPKANTAVTLITWIDYTPPVLERIVVARRFRCADVSVIIPVKDNQEGLERFLSAFFQNHGPGVFPREIVVVDNGSSPRIRIPERFARCDVPVQLVRCRKPGPASARNAGCRAARGCWFLFSDSDCEPTASFVSGFAAAMNGSIGYAGYVSSLGDDSLSQYYESQDILVPPRVREDRPQYLITANALVWRRAFEKIGGFDERFPLAGGEDVDLGFRLSQVGFLSYAPASVVRHDFSDGYGGFVRRFVRYGRGNRKLARDYGISLQPRPFIPARQRTFNWFAAVAQFLCLFWGYWTAPRERNPVTRQIRGARASRRRAPGGAYT
jgi:GT2 family glycosyltransferase